MPGALQRRRPCITEASKRFFLKKELKTFAPERALKKPPRQHKQKFFAAFFQKSRPCLPRLLGLAGWSGSGKTTLVVALLPLLRAAGLRVSTIKHAHHGLDLDKPGKDSFRHREAGAEEVLVVGGQRWALLSESPEHPPDPMALAARMAPVDLVLVEGFKALPIDKIEVYRPALGKPPLWPEIGHVVAVASDDARLEPPCPLLALNDPPAIARWIVAFARHSRGAA